MGKTGGESKLSKKPIHYRFITLPVFGSTIKYKDKININFKSIFKLSITVFCSMVSFPVN
jgi:hypothetical protein